MKRILYIFLLSLCATSLVQPTVNARTNHEVNYSLSEFSTHNKYLITTNNASINISRLEAGSYVMIFNASGRNIYKRSVDSGSISVPVRGKGLFIIRIQTNKEVFTQKILVK